MAGADVRGKKTARPLSPHLSIYRRQINMVMSILHRITGSALYVGTLLLAWWLIAAASGPDAYSVVGAVFGNPIGKLVLIGYTWALIHHALGGVRHLVWDTGRAFDIPSVNRLSWFTILGSLAITAALWGWALTAGGVSFR